MPDQDMPHPICCGVCGAKRVKDLIGRCRLCDKYICARCKPGKNTADHALYHCEDCWSQVTHCNGCDKIVNTLYTRRYP